MVGMPGAGKTHWVREHTAKHPEKRYNVLSTGALFDRMKVRAAALSYLHTSHLYTCSHIGPAKFFETNGSWGRVLWVFLWSWPFSIFSKTFVTISFNGCNTGDVYLFFCNVILVYSSYKHDQFHSTL